MNGIGNGFAGGLCPDGATQLGAIAAGAELYQGVAAHEGLGATPFLPVLSVVIVYISSGCTYDRNNAHEPVETARRDCVSPECVSLTRSAT